MLTQLQLQRQQVVVIAPVPSDDGDWSTAGSNHRRAAGTCRRGSARCRWTPPTALARGRRRRHQSDRRCRAARLSRDAV